MSLRVKRNMSKSAKLNIGQGLMNFCVPQNGVVDGTFHLVSGGSERTTTAGLNAINGYASKPHRAGSDVDGNMGDGRTAERRDCPTREECLHSETLRIIYNTLAHALGIGSPKCDDSKAVETMRRVVGELLEKHKYVYNGMINKLSLHEHGRDLTFVKEVAKSLFADGVANWGRIASLVSFGVVVCRRLMKTDGEKCVELVSQEISSYLLSDQRDWLVKNNAWDGFVEFFATADPESTMRNVLVTVAAFASIGATLVMLIR